MPNLINLPDINLRGINLDKTNYFFKLVLLLRGIFLILIFKATSGKMFCFFINILFGANGKIKFKGNLYFKETEFGTCYFPNKRITRIVGSHDAHFLELFNTYCLDKISFKKGDRVIDCGANVGELYFAFLFKNLDIEYIGFEPDEEVFQCLKKNINDIKHDLRNTALSHLDGKQAFYKDTEGANSSLSQFDISAKANNIISQKLDSLNFKDIKLLKLEAEGFEPEVLEGAKNTLKHINFISVDYGNERGVDQESTKVEVTEFLYNHNFKLVGDSKYRKIGLFQNKKFSNKQ